MVTYNTKTQNASPSQVHKIKKNHEEINSVTSSLFDLRTTFGQILFLLITISISVLIQLLPTNDLFSILINNTSISNNNSNTNYKTNSLYSTAVLVQNSNTTAEIKEISKKLPTYWIYGKSKDDSHLKHVHLVLKRLGYVQSKINESITWDLLWAHDYPFGAQTPFKLRQLKSHQKVNHFPGSGFLTNKVDLATTTQNVSYIPKSFKLPKDKELFLDYTAKYSQKLFVQKHNQHRHIKIKSINDIEFNDENTFIQEFIDNPYLVDGHKFDIGVYVIITSVDPLRVYIYKGDVLFRYCMVKYYPFDADNIDKYIVGDDYIPTWEIPSLSQYYNGLGFGMKDSFDAYVRKRDEDPTVIWKQVEDAIRKTILAKEQNIINILKSYPQNDNNFFEMMRFDLVIDAHLKVYLMEANMSPNLSSAHYQPNTLLYEQVIYNVMNLIGIGSYLYRESMMRQSNAIETMLSTDKNIVVAPTECTSPECTNSCELFKCKLCRSCLSIKQLNVLHQTYREHMNRGDTKRIFPVPIDVTTTHGITDHHENSIEFQELSQNNQLLTKWFYEKCKNDITWCS